MSLMMMIKPRLDKINIFFSTINHNLNVRKYVIMQRFLIYHIMHTHTCSLSLSLSLFLYPVWTRIVNNKYHSINKQLSHQKQQTLLMQGKQYVFKNNNNIFNTIYKKRYKKIYTNII